LVGNFTLLHCAHWLISMFFTRESSYCFSVSWPLQFCPSVRPSVCPSHEWISQNGAS